MADLWMPGATRHALGNEGAMNGGPARVVWHITSNEHDWTFKNELGWFTGGGASVAPHLLWEPFTGEIAQLFPADSRSLSLQNAGTVKTNRTGKYCIQIETVFTAGETVNGKKYNSVRDTPCKGLDNIMTWLRSLGIPDVWPGGAPAAFARDTVPLDTWLNRGGHYGHHQIPGNSHVDPGPMPDLFAAGRTPSTPSSKPKVDLSLLIQAAKTDPGAKQGHVTYKTGTNLVEAALVKVGYLSKTYAGDGSFGSTTVAAYAKWQRHLGYTGADANGVPGPTSLTKLGSKTGLFTVVA
jgi:hypothetical protein